MKIKPLMILIASILFVMLEPVSVFAQSDNKVPDLTDEPNSLTVYFFIQKTGVDTPIEGAGIAIHKIADLSVHDGSASYIITDEYASLKKSVDGRDVTLEGISVSESVALSKKFAKLTGEPEQTAVTDNNGRCTFSGLEKGMYLVEEISAVGPAADYEMFEPYMISVPLAENYTGSYVWNYNVLSVKSQHNHRHQNRQSLRSPLSHRNLQSLRSRQCRQSLQHPLNLHSRQTLLSRVRLLLRQVTSMIGCCFWAE